MKGIKWIELILGLWVLFSPWLAAGALTASNVIVGILIVLIAGVGLFGSKPKPQI